jgi:hypothetical protein
MFTQYLDCTIDIQPRSGDVFPFSIHAPGGDARGSFKLPTSKQDYLAQAEKLSRFDVDEEVLTQMGQRLFETLFHGPAKEVLVRSQGRLQPDQGLRIVLRIAPTEHEVAALPWEFLYDPDQGPLVMLDSPIVRYLPQQSVIPTLKTELPIKVLLTGAQPQELAKINVDRELQGVQSALADLVNQGRVKITAEPRLTRSKFQQLLRQGFHVWHFAGHGGFKSDGKTGALAFQDAQGDLDWASALELGIMLNRSGVRLILLDACESGRLATEPFRNLAPALIRAQVPAVIAMQFKVPDAAARAFAGELYRALSEGFPIDACVTEGRKAVMGEVGLGRPDWGIPVVYTRAEDGRLFDLPAAAQSTAPTPTAQSALPTLDADEHAEQIAELRDLLAEKQRRLHMLQLRAARTGSSTSPDVLMDIEDLDGKRDYRGNLLREGDIAKLKRRIAELGG